MNKNNKDLLEVKAILLMSATNRHNSNSSPTLNLRLICKFLRISKHYYDKTVHHNILVNGKVIKRTDHTDKNGVETTHMLQQLS